MFRKVLNTPLNKTDILCHEYLVNRCIVVQKQPPEVFCKGVPKNFAKYTGKHLCQSHFIKIETLAQVFSCEFCEISKNTFFTEYLCATASGCPFLL